MSIKQLMKGLKVKQFFNCEDLDWLAAQNYRIQNCTNEVQVINACSAQVFDSFIYLYIMYCVQISYLASLQEMYINIHICCIDHAVPFCTSWQTHKLRLISRIPSIPQFYMCNLAYISTVY